MSWTARRLFGEELKDHEKEKEIFKSLGYLVSVENRVVRRKDWRFAVQYRIAEKLRPHFSGEAGETVRAPWKTLITLNDPFLARRALRIIRETWTIDEYLKAEQKPDETKAELEETIEKTTTE